MTFKVGVYNAGNRFQYQIFANLVFYIKDSDKGFIFSTFIMIMAKLIPVIWPEARTRIYSSVYKKCIHCVDVEYSRWHVLICTLSLIRIDHCHSYRGLI